MKTRTICIILSGIFLLSGIVMSLSYRSNLKTADLSDENLAHFSVLSSADTEFMPLEEPDADKIVNDAEAILRVRATGNRTLTKYDILTEVVIEDIIRPYKDFNIGDSIYIYEEISVTMPENGYYDRLDFKTISNMMQKNEEYIVFLKFFKRPDGYKYSEKEQRTFLLTDKNFAVISPDKEPSYAIVGNNINNTVTYEEVKNVTCIVSKESLFKLYKDTRLLLLEKINSL